MNSVSKDTTSRSWSWPKTVVELYQDNQNGSFFIVLLIMLVFLFLSESLNWLFYFGKCNNGCTDFNVC